MKKLLFIISIAFVSCQKEQTCLDCVNAANRRFQACEDDLAKGTDMGEVARAFVSNGYQCEIYRE